MCPDCLLAAYTEWLRFWRETYYMSPARWFPHA